MDTLEIVLVLLTFFFLIVPLISILLLKCIDEKVPIEVDIQGPTEHKVVITDNIISGKSRIITLKIEHESESRIISFLSPFQYNKFRLVYQENIDDYDLIPI